MEYIPKKRDKEKEELKKKIDELEREKATIIIQNRKFRKFKKYTNLPSRKTKRKIYHRIIKQR
jgi:hypothetical protein